MISIQPGGLRVNSDRLHPVDDPQPIIPYDTSRDISILECVSAPSSHLLRYHPARENFCPEPTIPVLYMRLKAHTTYSPP